VGIKEKIPEELFLLRQVTILSIINSVFKRFKKNLKYLFSDHSRPHYLHLQIINKTILLTIAIAMAK